MTRFALCILTLITLSVGCTNIPAPNPSDFETPELDLGEEFPGVWGELEIVSVPAFLPPQDVLEDYPAYPGEQERFLADAFVFEGSEQATFVADGIVYEIDTDSETATAESHLTWCMLSEIRGGGDQPPNIVPVDIASSINGSLVTFSYEIREYLSFVLTCSFGATEETVGFTATVDEVISPRVQENGYEVPVSYSGTNANEVDLTVYLSSPE